MSPVEPNLLTALRRDFAQHRRFLWGLCYRMTGSANDADNLVQDTFERALRSPPPDTASSLRPWLARVAIHLSCDQLRKRKLERYRGTWLPEPVPTETLIDAESVAASSDARYDRLESATFAFLLALEVLSPTARAVLLLRDVFDYSVRETGEALGLGEANVKTTLHRARRAMAGYDAERCAPTRAHKRRTEQALRRFMLHLMTDNVRAIEQLLREDVVALNDPGDEFVAARKPVRGRDKVVLFHRKIMRFQAPELGASDPRFAIVDLNGLPAIVFQYRPSKAHFSPRQILRVDVDARGRIVSVHCVLALAKLTHVAFDRVRPVSLWQRLTSAAIRQVVRRLQAPRPLAPLGRKRGAPRARQASVRVR